MLSVAEGPRNKVKVDSFKSFKTPKYTGSSGLITLATLPNMMWGADEATGQRLLQARSPHLLGGRAC